MAPSRASLLPGLMLAAILLTSSFTTISAEFNQSASASVTRSVIPPKGSPEYLAMFRTEVQEYNNLILKPLLPESIRSKISHEWQIYVRNLLSGLALYYVTGGLWCVYVYGIMGKKFFPSGAIPKADDMWKQIAVSTRAMPLYVLMPTVSELMIERGWTRCYARVEEYGWINHLLLAATYMTVVEFGVYWMHRGLHEIKWAYKLLHATHHIYNKQNTLSPFAGLAFHPVDGMLQASPYVFALFLVPMHFFTHELLLFMTAVWTTNIHDCVDGQVWPVMGAGYHTIHHTTYKHNYGHYTVWMDWMCGTLRTPPRSPAASEKLAGAKKE